MTPSSPYALLAAALSDRYTLTRELGHGGMATVYLAHDLRHDRDVAVKVLHDDVATALGGDRFLREIRTTANLQHPNILPLFDSGAAGGQLYYVMPYVTGESLRDRLTREGRLPVADSVRIAGEVAGALDYAHRNGVIHRDVKPENVLLHDGHALVCDFGITFAPGATDSRLTGTGISIGTPAYMSPEQALGERTIDARTDVYAMGVMLYEMLAGTAPFTGSSMQAIVAKVLTEEPPSLSRVRRDLPPHLEATVLTALQKDPARRFDSAATMLEAIEGRRATDSPRRMLPTTVRRGALVALGLAVVTVIMLRRVPVRPPQAPSAPQHVADTAARRLVAEATEINNQRSPRICVESIRRSSRATEIDSLYPAAWAALARSRALCALFGVGDPSIEFAAARGPAETALRLDSTLADAYTVRGMVRLFREQDFDAAGYDFAAAARFDSTRYEPWLFRLWVHMANDHLDSALASVRHAKLIEPTNAPIVRTRLATILRYAGDTVAAEREIEDALRLYPANGVLTAERFELNVSLRRCDRARDDLASAQASVQQYSHSVVAYFWATCGDRPRAVRYADSVSAAGSGDAYVDEFSLALVYAGLQDSVAMYRWLDRAVTHHNLFLFYLRHHFAFRPNVNQPAYAALLRRARVR